MDSKTNKLDDEQSDDEFEEASEDDDAELFEMNLGICLFIYLVI